MKKILCTLSVIIAGTCFGQELPKDLNVAVKETKLQAADSLSSLIPDLAYYSKNYDKILGDDIYTFDNYNYDQQKIFIGNANSYYYYTNTPHIFRVMPLPGVNVDALMAMPCNAGYPAQATAASK